MRRGKFLLYTTFGTAIWNVVLVYLGALAGTEWERINKYMDIYSYIVVAVLGGIGILFALWFLKKRKSNKSSEEEQIEINKNNTD